MNLTDVDPPQFRQLLGHFATGVVVITCSHPDGRPAGMTANSLASVSLSPPLVLVCIEHQAEMYQTLLTSPGFVLNVLASHQEAISRKFAGPREPRFDGTGFRCNDQGMPVLDGVLAHIECQRHAEYPAGDHTVFVGRVTGGATSEQRPLLYYRGGYTGLGPA